MMRLKPLPLLLLFLFAACQSPAPADTTPPTIVSSTPASGATGIAMTSKLAVVFSEAMKQDSVHVSATPSLKLGAPVWNDAKTVVFDPPGGWQAGVGYSLSVAGKDLAGNALGGSGTISFQTALPPDTSAPATPTGVNATAGDGAFSVAWNANLEPDLAGYTVFFGATADTLANTINVDEPGLKADITGLENGKTYFFAVDAYDGSGNHSAKSGVGSVTPKDLTPPALLSSEPANGAQDLALIPVLRLTFSEPLDENSLELGMCETDDPPASATCDFPSPVSFGAPTWSEEDTVVRFTPTDQFQGGKTYVLVVLGKDKAGNDLGGQNKVAFSTRTTPDTTPPTVAGKEITQDTKTPSLSVAIAFSEAMDQEAVEDAFLSQPALGCAWTWAANEATCRVTSGLEQLTTYTLTLGTGATDTAGNPLAAPYQFTVATGNFNPHLVKVSPRNGAFNVAVNAPITFTFSEAMDQTSVGQALTVAVGTAQEKLVVPGTLTWNADNTAVTFQPSANYGGSKTVNWELTTAAREQGSGGYQLLLHLLAEVSGSFSTQLLAKQ